MKTSCVAILLITLSTIGLATQASGAGRPGSYLVLKGGIYSPGASFDLGNVGVETTFEGDTETGVNGEIAIGHYFLPTLSLGLGVGYFKGKGSFSKLPFYSMTFNVIPVTLSAKALIPAGPVVPYGLLGIGAYFTSFEATDNLNTFSGSSTLGLHVGGGINVNIHRNAFLGFEGRYVAADPSIGNQRITLSDTEYALNGFKLNGFITTLNLGYSF